MTDAEADVNKPTEAQAAAAPEATAEPAKTQPSTDNTKEAKTTEEEWPPLSAEDHRFYNTMSVKMNQFVRTTVASSSSRAMLT
jgi:hypothetical protein